MISVIVITKNEEERIKACLESVKWADELVVMDNGSTDKTLDIARKYTDKVFVWEGTNFAELRDRAMEKTSGEWVFYVDADERVLEPLKMEVKGLVQLADMSAFAVSRRNVIFGHEEKYGPFWPDWVIRLFKRSDFETWTGEVHEQAKFKGGLGYTKNSLLHLTHRDVDHMVLKSLAWSNIDAKLRQEAGHPKITGWRLLRILFSELFNQGVRRGGFFSGTVGVMDSLMQTFSLVITYIRLWELQQEKPRSEVYKEIDEKLIADEFKK